MERQLAEPMADGGRKTEPQVIYDVLSKNAAKPSFLQNIGIFHQPSGSKNSKLAAELEKEQREKTELQEVIRKHENQMDAM
jgi:hypothetical protein